MYSTLYIIGNGFDIAHSIPTCYCCFKNYLEHNRGTRDECEYCPFRNGKCERSECYIVSLLNTTNIDREWNDFEHALAFMDFRILGIQNDIKKFDSIIDELPRSFQDAFEGWVNHISIPPKENKLFALDPNALYITFNYTTTLEQMYEINKHFVHHIHHQVKPKESIHLRYEFGHMHSFSDLRKDRMAYPHEIDQSYIDDWCKCLIFCITQ